MIELPPLLTDEALLTWANPSEVAVVARESAISLVPALSKVPRVDKAHQIPDTTRRLIVMGGGMRIDDVKAWRSRNRPDTELLAIATRFGSGAEANGISVADDDGAKSFLVSDTCRPDARYYVSGALNTLSDDDIAWGVGDSLTHAIEGLLSPLASDELRADLARVVRRALTLSPARNPDWFEISALASAGQSKSSVGLVHGIAHALEPILVKRLGNRSAVGHARLCSAFLAPVLRFNFASSNKASARLVAQGLDARDILALAEPLSQNALKLPVPWHDIVRENWTSILLDPCSRTNVTAVRRGGLDHFLEQLGAGAGRDD